MTEDFLREQLKNEGLEGDEAAYTYVKDIVVPQTSDFEIITGETYRIVYSAIDNHKQEL